MASVMNNPRGQAFLRPDFPPVVTAVDQCPVGGLHASPRH